MLEGYNFYIAKYDSLYNLSWISVYNGSSWEMSLTGVDDGVLFTTRFDFKITLSDSIDLEPTSGDAVYMKVLDSDLKVKEEPKGDNFISLLPNPIVDYGSVVFRLSKSGRADIDVYDLLGRKLLDLTDDVYDPGLHTIDIDTRQFAIGTYFLVLRFDNEIYSFKFLISR